MLLRLVEKHDDLSKETPFAISLSLRVNREASDILEEALITHENILVRNQFSGDQDRASHLLTHLYSRLLKQQTLLRTGGRRNQTVRTAGTFPFSGLIRMLFGFER